jgi:hypothetical protein
MDAGGGIRMVDNTPGRSTKSVVDGRGIKRSNNSEKKIAELNGGGLGRMVECNMTEELRKSTALAVVSKSTRKER